MSEPRPEISVVIPTLNEEANAVAIESSVEEALAKAGVTRYEIIFIDNGSTDRTVELVKGLCAQKPHVRLIVNTRNFGQMRSPTHGIYQARGSAVIGMCADFQDPPSLIPELVARWRAGAMIVLGVRHTEASSMRMRLARGFGYGFLSRFADYPVIPGATGFGLFDRAVVETLRSWNEPEPFFRGMLVESGYPIAQVAYVRPGRAGGKSKNGFATLASFALSGLASSSKNLLRVPLAFAALLVPLAVLLLLGAAAAAALRGPWVPLLVAGAGAAGFGFTFLFLGVLGEQVRLIAERSRNVALVIEKERVNFDSDALPGRAESGHRASG
jgi:hypothetical protein